jgi:hypothetical protein
VLLYGQLTRTRVGYLYVPSSFTLEVVRPHGAVIMTPIPSPQANPALLEIGNINGEPGAELFVLVGRISSGFSAYLYTFYDNQLIRPNLTLGYGGDSELRAGFSCEVGGPPRLGQYSFVLQGPGETGLWQRTNTIYAWHGATLRMIARDTSEHRGLPPLAATGIGVGCGTLDRPTVIGSGGPSTTGT